MTAHLAQKVCPSCGGHFAEAGGETHPYMLSSAGCWAQFGQVLAREYSEPQLRATHRLSVDAYAVQHPGSTERRAIQSVGLHLARLKIQLDRSLPPRETNDVMLGLSKFKNSLPYLKPPTSFGITVADIPLDTSLESHSAAVREWASDAWSTWKAHHEFIRTWAKMALERR